MRIPHNRLTGDAMPAALRRFTPPRSGQENPAGRFLLDCENHLHYNFSSAEFTFSPYKESE
jgi:hypothetical protein